MARVYHLLVVYYVNCARIYLYNCKEPHDNLLEESRIHKGELDNLGFSDSTYANVPICPFNIKYIGRSDFCRQMKDARTLCHKWRKINCDKH